MQVRTSPPEIAHRTSRVHAMTRTTHPIAPLRPYFDVLAAATRSPRRARNGRRMAVGGSFLLHSDSAAPARRVVMYTTSTTHQARMLSLTQCVPLPLPSPTPS